MKFKEYGFRVDNITEALVPYMLLLILFVPFLLIFKFWENSLLSLYRSMYPFFYLSILGSILQEVLFRGWLMYQLKKIFDSPFKVIFINACLFALIHLFIPLQYIFIPISFIIGIGLATVYYYYPNIYLASLVHIIMNLVVPIGCNLKFLNC